MRSVLCQGELRGFSLFLKIKILFDSEEDWRDISMVIDHVCLLIHSFEPLLWSFPRLNTFEIDTTEWKQSKWTRLGNTHDRLLDNDYDVVYPPDISYRQDRHIWHSFEHFAERKKISRKFQEDRIYFKKTFTTFTCSNTVMMRCGEIIANKTNNQRFVTQVWSKEYLPLIFRWMNIGNK